MECGTARSPPPKLLRSLPDASNLRIESREESLQLFFSHRSPTQIWPFESRAIALVEPHILPFGRCPNATAARYGSGNEYAWKDWAHATPPHIAAAAMAATTRDNPIRDTRAIGIPPRERFLTGALYSSPLFSTINLHFSIRGHISIPQFPLNTVFRYTPLHVS